MAGPQGASAGAATVFRRVGASGWLVLAGSIPEPTGDSGWMDRLLGGLDLDRPVVWLTPDPEAIEPGRLIDDLEDALLTSVAVMSPSEGAWEEAGLLLVQGFSATHLVSLGPRLRACLDDGGVILAMEASATAFGEATASSSVVQDGLGWLPGAAILLEREYAGLEPTVRGWLQSPERRIALRLPAGSVFALGPGSEAAVWDGPPPGIVLGSGWTRA
jgi:hypothetical protein